jgi:hypothetical protein
VHSIEAMDLKEILFVPAICQMQYAQAAKKENWAKWKIN